MRAIVVSCFVQDVDITLLSRLYASSLTLAVCVTSSEHFGVSRSAAALHSCLISSADFVARASQNL